MGSLRNPVGPLPSSIYWRRRVVLLSLVALLALLVVWIVTSGGGGGRKNSGSASDGKHPTPSTITPGPSGSGPAISQHPGGRDDSGGGDSGGSGAASGGGTASGAPGGDGSGSGSGAGGGSGSGSDAGAGAGAVLPAGSTLPNCASGAVSLSLRSVHNTYAPGQTPTFELTAKNSSGTDCKVDLGPKSAVLTISKADGSTDYWSSDDCPKTAGNLLYRVPAGSAITYTVRWDRKPSAPQCATPPAGSAGAGTYLVEAKVPGYGKLQTSFVLSAD
ncbi:hypothetical protein [Streptomyces sp. NRRL S-813]|uniref:hypothetical protein n=1 Tax=Streptomyces sp. NRRL S-813 TaxID=1463919 RepID=UPI0004BF7DF7|nr:hypothetical protein [Streptomyces sp. NRRL S-813]